MFALSRHGLVLLMSVLEEVIVWKGSLLIRLALDRVFLSSVLLDLIA
jgi:hypothetical protein